MDLLLSIRMFYGKLDCNSATRTGPTPNIPYSGKFLYGAEFGIFRTSILYAKKNENLNVQNFRVNLDPTTRVASLVFCQVVKQLVLRPVGISPSIATEAKRLINLELCHHALLCCRLSSQ